MPQPAFRKPPPTYPYLTTSCQRLPRLALHDLAGVTQGPRASSPPAHQPNAFPTIPRVVLSALPCAVFQIHQVSLSPSLLHRRLAAAIRTITLAALLPPNGLDYVR